VEALNGAAKRVPVSESSQLAEARRVALGLARAAGFDETKAGKAAIAVTEAASNLLKHAGRGEILLQTLDDKRRGRGVEMLALDKGPGIENVGESLRDGYSTAGSAGEGLGAISRQADVFDIYSRPGLGTGILAQFWARPATVPEVFETGGISIAVEGEQVCGDVWSFRVTPDGMSAFVADGLGHGSLAEAAARNAVVAYESHAAEPLPELLDVVHRASQSTRGAAVAVARLNPASRRVEFAGVGNIAAVLAGAGGMRHMVSMSGIIGHHVRSFREFTYEWEPGALLILHSDGVGTRWDLAAYPGLARKHCSLIAGVLWRDMARGRDDATVFVAREGSR